MVKKQNCVMWIQRVSLYTSKQMVFRKILQKMLEQDLALKIMNQNAIPLKGCYQKEKIKKKLD